MAASGPAPVARAVTLPGEPTQTSTLALEKGAAALQSFKPVNRMHAHLCAFHFYAYDMGRQVEAHHYCTHYNEEMRQCAIFDTPEADARLIGIEYIVSERLFKTLPDEEKKFWHSHDYEVTGGILFLPGVPKVAERAALSEVKLNFSFFLDLISLATPLEQTSSVGKIVISIRKIQAKKRGSSKN
jgi:hypothetical protein